MTCRWAHQIGNEGVSEEQRLLSISSTTEEKTGNSVITAYSAGDFILSNLCKDKASRSKSLF